MSNVSATEMSFSVNCLFMTSASFPTELSFFLLIAVIFVPEVYEAWVYIDAASISLLAY